MTAKTCSKCGTEKPLTDFYPHWSAVDGRSGFCKACAIEDDRKRRQRKQQQKESMQSKKPTQSKPAAPPTKYEPLTMRDLPQPVLRPGALDHEKYGSHQPDGTVKPYARPVCEPCYRQPQALQPRYSNN